MRPNTTSGMSDRGRRGGAVHRAGGNTFQPTLATTPSRSGGTTQGPAPLGAAPAGRDLGSTFGPASFGVTLGEASPSFVKKLSAISQEPEFLDFTIACDGISYKVSRLVISAHSPYFKRACTGSFKEGFERKIDLHEDEPAAVRAMINFFRVHDYQCFGPSLSLHIGVFIIADKYEVLQLKEVALKYFVKALILLPKQELTGTLVSITAQAYAATPADARLRDVLLMQWRKPGITSSAAAELETLVGDCPAFGSDLILALTKQEMPKVAADTKKVVYDYLTTSTHVWHTVASVTTGAGLSEDVVLAALDSLGADGKVGRFGTSLVVHPAT